MIPSLLQALKQVPDHRARNSTHPLASILAMAVCAMLCGSTSVLAMSQWGKLHGRRLAKALGFRRRYTPCNTSLHYIFRALDVAEFQRVLNGWLASITPAQALEKLEAVVGKQALAVDGKTQRGACDSPDTPGVAMVAAFLHHGGQVLDQEPVIHGDELEAVRTVLKRLPLENRIVTGDALQTQRDVSAAIVEEKKRKLFLHSQGQSADAPSRNRGKIQRPQHDHAAGDHTRDGARAVGNPHTDGV